MTLPAAIDLYFATDKTLDDAALTQCFAPDGMVTDEGARHVGTAEIRAWWRAAKEKYHHTAEPMEQTVHGDQVVVRAKVSGDFPNSPAMLDFSFSLKGGLISALEIH